MKLKIFAIVFNLGLLISSGNAATMAVNNLVNGPGDILYADSSNTLMSGGIVTMGYFASGVAPTSIAELQAALGGGQYTLVTSAPVGDTTFALGEDVDGYASQSSSTTVPGGSVISGGALFGRSIYSIVANNSNLGSATEFALVQIGSFASDSPFEQSYTSNPGGGTVIIGTIDTIELNPNPALPTGNGTYSTLKMTAVPEPSSMLLGALGALALLRRRR